MRFVFLYFQFYEGLSELKNLRTICVQEIRRAANLYEHLSIWARDLESCSGEVSESVVRHALRQDGT